MSTGSVLSGAAVAPTRIDMDLLQALAPSRACVLQNPEVHQWTWSPKAFMLTQPAPSLPWVLGYKTSKGEESRSTQSWPSQQSLFLGDWLCQNQLWALRPLATEGYWGIIQGLGGFAEQACMGTFCQSDFSETGLITPPLYGSTSPAAVFGKVSPNHPLHQTHPVKGVVVKIQIPGSTPWPVESEFLRVGFRNLPLEQAPPLILVFTKVWEPKYIIGWSPNCLAWRTRPARMRLCLSLFSHLPWKHLPTPQLPLIPTLMSLTGVLSPRVTYQGLSHPHTASTASSTLPFPLTPFPLLVFTLLNS